MRKLEFVKPVFDIDTYFKIADELIHSDNLELEEVGRTMRKVYANKMAETEYREVDSYANSAECKTGICD